MSSAEAYALDLMILPNDKIAEFDKFMKEYGNKSDKYLFREMMRVKAEVSTEVLQKHLKNLDALSKMEGFVTDEHRRRIEMVKDVLTRETPAPRQKTESKGVAETQFFVGSSLLLWFLALAAIWRRPWGFPRW